MTLKMSAFIKYNSLINWVGFPPFSKKTVTLSGLYSMLIASVPNGTLFPIQCTTFDQGRIYREQDAVWDGQVFLDYSQYKSSTVIWKELKGAAFKLLNEMNDGVAD